MTRQLTTVTRLLGTSAPGNEGGGGGHDAASIVNICPPRTQSPRAAVPTVGWRPTESYFYCSQLSWSVNRENKNIFYAFMIFTTLRMITIYNSNLRPKNYIDKI